MKIMSYPQMAELKSRIIEVRQKIDQAARSGGRSGQDVTLVAVSKTIDISLAQLAFDLGIRDFGENRTQELKSKQQAIPQANWHMIGRLQTNKVKDVVGKAVLIHSLDSWHLAQEINKRAQYLNIEMPVLLQVNISGETQKAGVDPADVREFLDSVGELSALRVNGFMTMAPLNHAGEESRPIFAELAALRDELILKSFPQVDLKYLSMGMSQDYEVAVEEGANLVRIGSAIFT